VVLLRHDGVQRFIAANFFGLEKCEEILYITFFMSILINTGMWFERFVIIVTSVYRDYLPSSWSVYYSPSPYEIGFYVGTFGLFFYMLFPILQIFFPVIATAEIKHILKVFRRKIIKIKMEEQEVQTVENFAHEYAH